MTEAQKLTLADFLLARIAEDEAIARRCRPAGMKLDPHLSSLLPAQATHFARFGPRRVLPECEAKRRIVEHATDEFRVAADGYQMLPPILEMLALPYADHPDYRDEWRP